MMQLLGTSDRIAFERKYPFEKRQATGLLAWAHSLREPMPTPGLNWLTDDYLWWIDPAAFQVTVSGDPLFYGRGIRQRDDLRRRAVRGLWQAFSDTLRTDWPEANWYAEKYGGFGDDLVDAGVTVHYLDLVRDPRDIWASVLSFDAKRGSFGFGRLAGQTNEEYLHSFASSLRRRLDAMRATPTQVPRLVVRYEDLVGDLSAQADRIGRWAGVRLDPDAVTGARESYRHHMTTADVGSSAGRWRQDVSADHRGLLAEVLGPLEDFGYR